MQIVYATHLPLPNLTNGSQLDAAIAALRSWTHRRFGSTLEPFSGGQADVGGVRITWDLMTGEAGGLFGVWIDQSDSYANLWRWCTYADIGVEHGQAWFRVRVQLYTQEEGLLTTPQVLSGRPGVVREIVDTFDIELDGRPLGRLAKVTGASADEYLRFLEDANRRLPVVAISADPKNDTFLDPTRVADRLLGLAHVAVLDRDAAWDITNTIGRQLSVYQGAVRIYWPGFTTADEPRRHRLYLDGALDFLGTEGLQQELFDVLGRLAGLSLDEPGLRRALTLERRRCQMEQRVEERAASLARVANAAATAGSVSAAEFAEFAKEYEELEEAATTYEQDALEAQRENNQLRSERDAAREQVIELSRAFADQAGSAPVIAAAERPARTVAEAVERARTEAQHVVYLPEALRSASESEYEDPTRLLEDLRLIEEIAQDWALGELAQGPHNAFKQRSSAYRPGISQTAKTTYKSDYERSREGRTFLLGPHLRRGIGPVSAIMRIYMYFDTRSIKIIIGHVGRKLRDDGNRN